MRTTRRFIFTGIFVALTLLIVVAARKYQDLLYLFYTSISREVQGFLSNWSGKFGFVLWQAALVLLLLWGIASLVITIVRRGNILRWISGVTLIASLLSCLFMLLWGANYYGPTVAENMRLDVKVFSVEELQKTTEYYRDLANQAADQVSRDAEGIFAPADFDTLAGQAGDGYHAMTRVCHVFGGSTDAPVKALHWGGLFSRLGTTGITVCFTGEACVNPKTFAAALPMTMAHELAHRMSIAREDDANFAAILTCTASSYLDYQYSGYFMAYLYCYNALYEQDPDLAGQVGEAANENLRRDLAANNIHYDKHSGTVQDLAQSINDTYLKSMGEDRGVEAYDDVADLLVAWYLDQNQADAPAEPDAGGAGATPDGGETAPETETE